MQSYIDRVMAQERKRRDRASGLFLPVVPASTSKEIVLLSDCRKVRRPVASLREDVGVCFLLELADAGTADSTYGHTHEEQTNLEQQMVMSTY